MTTSTSWIQAALQTQNAASAEALSDALLAAGALSVSMEDADAGTPAEQPQFAEPGEAPASLWARSRVIALFDAKNGLNPIRERIAEACAAARLDTVPPCTFSRVAEQNWVALTQSQFDPIRINERLWIVPSWHDEPDPAAINIRLDPGMAFGTGSHPTTHLCLDWLSREVRAGSRVLDYGCGSGILAIAAARLGAAQVTALDIDGKALEATARNARDNNVSLHLLSADDRPNGQFDLVVANILTNPLCVLAPVISACLAPGGRIALSGVLSTQAQQVIDAWQDYLPLTATAQLDGWVRLEGVRSS